MRDIARKTTAEEKRTLFEAFRHAMQELEADPFERGVFEHFDPIAWADSKLTGEPFAARIRQRMLAVERAA